MRAVKAIFKNGKVKLTEQPPLDEQAEVLVIFPEADGDARWEEILSSTKRRPALEKRAAKALKDFKAGKTKPLSLDDL